jgi:hypothetical protein
MQATAVVQLFQICGCMPRTMLVRCSTVTNTHTIACRQPQHRQVVLTGVQAKGKGLAGWLHLPVAQPPGQDISLAAWHCGVCAPGTHASS